MSPGAAHGLSDRPTVSLWRKGAVRTIVSFLTIDAIRKILERSTSLKVEQRPGQEKHADYMQSLRQGVRTRMMLTTTYQDAQMRQGAVDAKRAVDAGEVVTQRGAEDDEKAAWQQGDASMYTKDKIQQRAALRRHPAVLEVLQDFWGVVTGVCPDKEIPVGARCPICGKLAGVLRSEANEPTVAFDAYEALYERIYRAVLEEWDPADASATIAEDWQNDTKGCQSLTREAFFDSLFELADHWCATVEAREYVTFIKNLFDEITVHHPPGYALKGVGSVSFNSGAFGDAKGDIDELHGDTTNHVVSSGERDHQVYGDNTGDARAGSNGGNEGDGGGRGNGCSRGSGDHGGNGGDKGDAGSLNNGSGLKAVTQTGEGKHGSTARKQRLAEKTGRRSAAVKMQSKFRGKAARKEKDDRNKAVAKLQAAHRGKKPVSRAIASGGDNAAHSSQVTQGQIVTSAIEGCEDPSLQGDVETHAVTVQVLIHACKLPLCMHYVRCPRHLTYLVLSQLLTVTPCMHHSHNHSRLFKDLPISAPPSQMVDNAKACTKMLQRARWLQQAQ